MNYNFLNARKCNIYCSNKKKNIILSEYTDYSGNFEQTIKKIMKNISDKNIENDIYKATIFISKLKIFILKNQKFI